MIPRLVTSEAVGVVLHLGLAGSSEHFLAIVPAMVGGFDFAQR